jgi:hypothetical protein
MKDSRKSKTTATTGKTVLKISKNPKIEKESV